jgi:glycosyltransferase involved in cell wall biosynthesis
MADQRVSFLIPALDEAQSLDELHAEIADVIEAESLDAEVVFVDDGSADDTWAVLSRIVERDDRCRAVRLRRNFGKTAALVAGLRETTGDVIVTLDADGQDVPAEVPRLLAALDDNTDLVNGHKSPRHDPWSKTWPSRVFNALVNLSSGMKLHDHNSGLKVMRREVLDDVQLYGNLHRFLPWLAHAQGFAVRELPVKHRPRRYGRSKYGAWRFITGLLDILLVRLLSDVRGGPQRVLGLLGIVAAGIGTIALAYLAVVWLTQFADGASYHPLTERPLLFYGLGALLVGAQLTTLGVLAGLLPAFVGGRAEPRVRVREVRGREVRADDKPVLRLEKNGPHVG